MGSKSNRRTTDLLTLNPQSASSSFRFPASDFRFRSPLPGLRLLGCSTPGPPRGRPPLDTAPVWCWNIFTSSFRHSSFSAGPRFLSRWRPVPSMAPGRASLPPSMAAGTSCPEVLSFCQGSFRVTHRLGFAATGTLGSRTTRVVAAFEQAACADGFAGPCKWR